jgi:DNA-binding beta-propeller fold protein YncE
MKFGLVGFLAAGVMLGVSMAQAHTVATKKWTLGGFAHPESVDLDLAHGVLYVSSIGGGPLDKDGNGYISKVSKDGKMLEQKWITGLNGPKGIVIDGFKMYVSDIDQLVEIDTRTGKIVAKYDAVGAKFLNDTAVDAAGNVYVSDIAKSTIWQLKDGKMSLWYDKPGFQNPNGLRVIRGDKLLVAGFGTGMHDDGAMDTKGSLLTIDLKTKELKNLGDGRGIGALDGLERNGRDGFYATDFNAGALYNINRDGSFETVLDLKAGSADMDQFNNGHSVVIPQMLENEIEGYSVKW